MSYYIGSILEINGGMEYDTTFLLDTRHYADEEAFKRVSMQWRGSDEQDWVEADSGFWEEHTLIKAFVPEREIDREEADIAQKYLTLIGVA